MPSVAVEWLQIRRYDMAKRSASCDVFVWLCCVFLNSFGRWLWGVTAQLLWLYSVQLAECASKPWALAVSLLCTFCSPGPVYITCTLCPDILALPLLFAPSFLIIKPHPLLSQWLFHMVKLGPLMLYSSSSMWVNISPHDKCCCQYHIDQNWIMMKRVFWDLNIYRLIMAQRL